MSDAPPLRVWLGAAALSLLIAGALSTAFAFGLDERYDFAVPSAHARLAAIAKQRHGRLVLIVGSSLVNTAVPSSDYFADRIGDTFQVEVVAVNGGSIDWFNAIRPRLEALHPDLLVVQQDLLLPVGEDPRNLLEHTNDFLIGWRYVLQSYLLKRRGPACTSHPSSEDVDRFRAYYQTRYDPGILPLAALATLSGIRDDGIAVVLLGVPRFALLEQAAPNIGRWEAALRQAANARGLAVWSSPDRWENPADFCDVGHMNQVGRAAFGGWLADQLVQGFATP